MNLRDKKSVALHGQGWWWLWLGVLLLMACGRPAEALEAPSLSAASRSDGEITIEAQTMQVSTDQNRVVFSGQVEARRDDVYLRCDRLIAIYARSESRTDNGAQTQITRLEAQGSLVITTPRQKITGDWAKMDIRADTLLVGGDVAVTQGESIIHGRELAIDFNTNQGTISGGEAGGRVKGSFAAPE